MEAHGHVSGEEDLSDSAVNEHLRRVRSLTYAGRSRSPPPSNRWGAAAGISHPTAGRTAGPRQRFQHRFGCGAIHEFELLEYPRAECIAIGGTWGAMSPTRTLTRPAPAAKSAGAVHPLPLTRERGKSSLVFSSRTSRVPIPGACSEPWNPTPGTRIPDPTTRVPNPGIPEPEFPTPGNERSLKSNVESPAGLGIRDPGLGSRGRRSDAQGRGWGFETREPFSPSAACEPGGRGLSFSFMVSGCCGRHERLP
jgi:hypothetical protein